MKKILLSTLFLMMAFLPSVAQAVCTQSGFVERVTTRPGAAASFIYIRNSALTNFTFSGSTTDAKIIDAAVSASTSRTRVTIRGSRATCLATGANRNIGGVLYIIVSP